MSSRQLTCNNKMNVLLSLTCYVMFGIASLTGCQSTQRGIPFSPAAMSTIVRKAPYLLASFASQEECALRISPPQSHRANPCSAYSLHNVLRRFSGLPRMSLRGGMQVIDIVRPQRNASKVGEDIVGDGGIIKRTIRNATSVASPRRNDFVYIHYRCYNVSSTVPFDDSRTNDERNNEPFGFLLGRGDVMRAWELAVSTMKAGEVSLFFVRNEYTFATDGARLKGLFSLTSPNHIKAIPPGADIICEIELVDFGKGRFCTADRKVRLFEDIDHGRLEPFDRSTSRNIYQVLLHLSVSVGGEKLLDTQGVPAEYPLGRGLLPPGLELVVRDFLFPNVSTRLQLIEDWARNCSLFRNLSLMMPKFSTSSLSNRSSLLVMDVNVSLVDWDLRFPIDDRPSGWIECVGLQARQWYAASREEGDWRWESYWTGELYEDNVEDGSRIILSFRLKAKMNSSHVILYDRRLMHCELGDGRLPAGVEMSLPMMKVGQRGRISFSKVSGLYRCRDAEEELERVLEDTSNTTMIEFDVIVHGLEGNSTEPTPAEKIVMAEERKSTGNRFFKLGLTSASQHKYNSALLHLDYEELESSNEFIDANTYQVSLMDQGVKQKLMETRGNLYLNLAACQRRLGNRREAVKLCDQALEVSALLSPQLRCKANRWKSLALLEEDDYELAKQAADKAAEIDPDNEEVQMLLRKVAAHHVEIMKR